MVRHLSTLVLCVFVLAVQSFCQKSGLLSSLEFEKQTSQPGIQVLDVRTSQEYTSGHIKNALQADWLNSREFKERVQYLDKSTPVFVYCGSGVRSNEAAKWLRSNGFSKVSELENGFVGWKKNNRPIESETSLTQMSIAEYKSLTDTASVVLVDFGATWCPPCKKMEPVLEQLQNDLSTKFILIKVDAGVHTNIMQQLQIEKLPTFILYRKGKEIWRKEGLVSLEEFKTHIQ